MITISVQASSLDELRTKLAGLLNGAPVATAETEPQEEKKKAGRPKKETTVVASKTDEPPPAPVVPEDKYSHMKSLLQKVAQMEKDTDKGFERALKVIHDVDTGIDRIRDIPADKYDAVIAAAEKELKGTNPLD